MSYSNANHSIKCNVSSCKNHCGDVDYCSLGVITIGTHETDPKMDQCTDCRSFANRDMSEQIRAEAKNSIEHNNFQDTERHGFFGPGMDEDHLI